MRGDAVIVRTFRQVAREHGYAIGLHGSQRAETDLDLIAVPWTAEAAGPFYLLAAIERATFWGRIHGHETYTASATRKPHGRWAWALCPWTEKGAPEGYWRVVDLSVFEPSGPSDG